jgi:hypothetical protein
MKNKFHFIGALAALLLLVVASCKKVEPADSMPQPTSIPYIAVQYISDAYVYGLGQSNIINDVPDVVAIAVDSVVGFEGGYGGKTGSDSIKILKSEILEWPDTTGVGGYSIGFEKFNRANFKAFIGSNIVIAGAIPNPGPTAMEGTYKRTSNGVLIELKKVFDGVYVIDNPGGAGVPPFPYLFYNYKNAAGGDSLAFPNQGNPCKGGLQLVGPDAPVSLASSDYTSTYPPLIIATSPLTFRWKVFEFPAASTSSAHTGAALCQWGLGVRTFEKQ